MGTQSLFPPSSEQELLALRRRCASSLWGLVPSGVGRLYFGSSGARSGKADRLAGGSSSTLRRTGPSTGDVSSPPNCGLTSQAAPQQKQQQTQRRQQQRRPASNPTGASDHPADHMSTSGAGVTGGPRAAPGRTLHIDSGPGTPGVSEDDDERIVAEIESSILDVFGDAYCNKHLMYGALELLLVRLMPELADRGVLELWAERLN